MKQTSQLGDRPKGFTRLKPIHHLSFLHVLVNDEEGWMEESQYDYHEINRSQV